MTIGRSLLTSKKVGFKLLKAAVIIPSHGSYQAGQKNSTAVRRKTTPRSAPTLDTIARHEQEINELAGKKNRPVLYWNGVGAAPTIAFDTVDISYVKTYSETGFATQRSITLGTLTLVSGYYTKIEAYRDWETDRKSTRLNSSHRSLSRMPSSA